VNKVINMFAQSTTFVQSFHNRLHSFHKNRRRNKRIDDLINILIVDESTFDARWWRHRIPQVRFKHAINDTD